MYSYKQQLLKVSLVLCTLVVSCREPYRYSYGPQFENVETDEAIQTPVNQLGSNTERSLTAWQEPRTRMIRLTQAQFISKVVSLFGEEARPTSRIPSDLVVEGSKALGTSKSIMIERDTELFAKVAEEVAASIVENNSLLSSFSFCFDEIKDSFVDPVMNSNERDHHLSCLTKMAEGASYHIWGRSLDDVEWSHAYTILAKGLDLLKLPNDSFSFYLSWLLQSPHFLYRVESLVDSSDGLKIWTQVSLAK